MKRYLILFFVLVLSSCGRQRLSTESTEEPASAASLQGEWRLTENNELVKGLNQRPMTLVFETGEKIKGFAGCNHYQALLSSSKLNVFSVEQLISTEIACPALDVEHTFLSLLKKANKIKRKGDQLLLFKDNLLLLTFER